MAAQRHSEHTLSAAAQSFLRLLDAPVVVVTGHYGVGKTNFCLNLALDAAASGVAVTLVDLDVVNPFFRSSDYASLLGDAGVTLIAPVFAGTNLDGPSLLGTILPAIEQAQQNAEQGSTAKAKAQPRRMLLIDAGGDDVGATALGRFARAVKRAPYQMLYVVNRSRNLTQQPDEAVEVLREIEQKAHLQATAVINNTHLQDDTDIQIVEQGIPFAERVAQLVDLPLLATTVPQDLEDLVAGRKSDHLEQIGAGQVLYPVRVYVRTPWQQHERA